ncbi:hypothetical protein [Methylomonas sp.]|uniref:hypothetical protein n=1 Tax=Methylomonas sp. TaxID=418 RepID=UPI0025D263C7|nr:hypothetical protein [Methylomonas sp.]
MAKRWETLTFMEARAELLHFMRFANLYIRDELFIDPVLRLIENTKLANVGTLVFRPFCINLTNHTDVSKCDMMLIDILVAKRAKNIFPNLHLVLHHYREVTNVRGCRDFIYFRDGIFASLMDIFFENKDCGKIVEDCVNFAFANGAELFNESKPWDTIDNARFIARCDEKVMLSASDIAFSWLVFHDSSTIAQIADFIEHGESANVSGETKAHVFQRKQAIPGWRSAARCVLAHAKSTFVPIVASSAMPSKITDSPFSALNSDSYLLHWIWKGIYSELF